VWKNIVKELENAGFTGYTWKQAEDKWKNLRKEYMKVKDNKKDKSSKSNVQILTNLMKFLERIQVLNQ